MSGDVDRQFQAHVDWLRAPIEPDESDEGRPCCGNCGQPVEFWTEFAESTSAGVVRPLVIHHIVNQGTRQPHECASQRGQ